MVDSNPTRLDVDVEGFMGDDGKPEVIANGCKIASQRLPTGGHMMIVMLETDGFRLVGSMPSKEFEPFINGAVAAANLCFGKRVFLGEWNDPEVKPVAFHNVLIYVKDTPPFEEHMYDVGCWNNQTGKWVRSIGGEDEEVQIFGWAEIPAFPKGSVPQ